MKITIHYISIFSFLFLLLGCTPEQQNTGGVYDEQDTAGVYEQEIKDGVSFDKKTLRRVGEGPLGDNWCTTWANDDSQITSMDDGSWLDPHGSYHNRLYKITGSSDFNHNSDVTYIDNYPIFRDGGKTAEDYERGWYGYGILAIDKIIYSAISLTPKTTFDPFIGVKLLKSPDNGETWYRVNKQGETRKLPPGTGDLARYDSAPKEMLFYKEFGGKEHGRISYPFVWLSFVQNGKAGKASKDGYIYIYSPEGSDASKLLLARVAKDKFEKRSNWEYFKSWNGSKPVWSKDINQRGVVHKFPVKNKNNDYFGWYSWLPSVVWNEGLGVYIMVNGGTYAGIRMTQSESSYYDSWAHTKSGSLGFWYAKKPYGPWKKFYYVEHFTVDHEDNRIYQPKLSPKWISKDGKKMTMIWSDAGKNDKGDHYSDNYTWNQMEIEIKNELWDKQ